MTIEKYTVFVIYAYEMEAPDGSFMRSVECQVIAKDEAEAMKRVKVLCPTKKHHFLKTIIETYVKA
jgi:hypothetical protein